MTMNYYTSDGADECIRGADWHFFLHMVTNPPVRVGQSRAFAQQGLQVLKHSSFIEVTNGKSKLKLVS